MKYRIVKSLVTDDVYLLKDDGYRINIQILEVKSQQNKQLETNTDYLFAEYKQSDVREIADLIMNPHNWRSFSHREVEEKYPGCFVDQVELTKYKSEIDKLKGRIEELEKENLLLTKTASKSNKKLQIFIDNAKNVLKQVAELKDENKI